MKNKGTVYIRRLREGIDKTEDIKTAYAMTLFKYGLFRRGYPNSCLLAAQSKLRIKQQFLPKSWKEVKLFFRERSSK